MSACDNCIARPGSKWHCDCKLDVKCKETPGNLREPVIKIKKEDE